MKYGAALPVEIECAAFVEYRGHDRENTVHRRLGWLGHRTFLLWRIWRPYPKADYRPMPRFHPGPDSRKSLQGLRHRVGPTAGQFITE